MSTIVLLALNALIGTLSTVILALVAHSTSSSAPEPPDAKGTGRAMLFWPGVGGIVDMCLFAILWFKTTRPNKHTKIYSNALLFVTCFIFARPFITLVYTFAEWGRAVKGQAEVQSGYVTVETASCAGGDGGTCRELRAARWLLVPEVVLGAAMVGLVVRQRMKAGGLRGEKGVKV